MNVLNVSSRRLLDEAAATFASTPSSSDANADDVNDFDLNGRFTPSMAIILVVLLSAFFFMAFFSIYVKRCASGRPDAQPRAAPVASTTEAGPQGVDVAFLETLPLIAYSSAKKRGSNVECVVCLADFEEGEALCQLPRCKHVFHKDCVNMWLFSHTSCPLCRRSVMADGTRSFRWGVGSGSLRLSSRGARGSRRGGQGMPAEARAVQTSLERIQSDRFPRSHSTGHSLSKQAKSGALRLEVMDAEEEEGQASGRCLAFGRSRSFATLGEEGAAQSTIGGWVREAGASLKRVLSMKRAGSVGAVASSSAAAAAAFNRIGPPV